MSSSLRRSKLEALKQGNLSSDDDEEEYYNEEDQDNFEDDLDDFVIDDKDIGYKASAHQKQSQPRNVRNRNKPKATKSKVQSYSISRRNRQNSNNNKSKTLSQSTKPKTQSTMKSFFKASTNKPRSKSRPKKKHKPSQKKNDDFMSTILTNMDSDDDGDDDDNQVTTNNNEMEDVPMDDANENHDMNMDPIDDKDVETIQTQPQTQAIFYSTQDTVQSHHSQSILNDEPPKKRFKLAEPSNNNDKIERSDDDIKDVEPEHTMFSIENKTPIEPENTDNYPECKAGYIDFYWFDAYEDAVRKPGQIYLFGKTLNRCNNEWSSLCVFIKNIQRTMYVLPRLKNKNDDIENGERVEFINVYNEINEKRQRLGIRKFAAGPIDKKYCFRERGNGIPSKANYLKLCYSFDFPPFDIPGTSYTKVFGSRSTALELFMLEKQIMGPCWLRLPLNKASRIVSFCKKELEMDDIDKITVLSSNYPSPSFKVLSLSFQTVLNDKKEHEIACISGVIHNAVYVDHKHSKDNANNGNMDYFSFIRKIDRNPFPYDLEKELKKKNYTLNENTFRSFSTERELLTFFLTRIHKLDPDVIVGHKLYDFLLDVMLHRMDRLNVSQWSKIGRLRKGKIPFIKGRLMKKYLGSGRLLCDTFISSQEFIHEKTYTLSHLVKQILDVKDHQNINVNDICSKWFDGAGLASIITHCCNDSNLVFMLMQKLEILALTKELTNLCGNLWCRSLTSQRAERNEWLLLHEFYRNEYIVPERWTKQEKIDRGILKNNKSRGKKRGKAQYSGGLVLEPQRGLYDKYVICLDFNSLYPSIIQEYNLCFTSTPHWKYDLQKDEDEKNNNITSMQQSISAETGILPKVIGVLLTRRTSVKNVLKSAKIESEKKRLDIQQKALKLVANSMYGCLGFSHSRFYCKPIAALITALGRESLMKASSIASEIGNLKVIYGDTDSIFIYTDSDNLITARNYAKEIKKKVNKTYNKMYLELDYVFSKMLLLRKKKYAAIKVISFETDSHGNAINIFTKKEIKGLDLVRRDWSIISKDVGKAVLDIILSKDKQIDDVIIEIHELLQKYRTLFDENKIELNKFLITKKLTKRPKDYPDPTKQPHVMVAMEMQKMGININTGSFIEYIICKQNRDASDVNKSISKRAYHITEIEKSVANGNVLSVDREWYLEQQILPPVGRYCEPIQGTDFGHLAHALGLDSNKFNHLIRKDTAGNNNDDDDDDIDDKILRIINPLQKYAEICVPLKIKCRYCGNSYDFGGVFNFKRIDAKCGLICATANCKGIVSEIKTDREIDVKRIKNDLSLQIWHFIYKYYGREWICSDIECNHKTRQTLLNGNKCPKIGCNAAMKETYTAMNLFDQLRYFAFLFDISHQTKVLKQEKLTTKLTTNQESVLNDIYKWIKQTVLQRSNYYFIDSKVIFKYCI